MWAGFNNVSDFNDDVTIKNSLALPAMEHWGTCPLDFQLFNFSGHLRAAQTLTLYVVVYPDRIILAYNFSAV